MITIPDPATPAVGPVRYRMTHDAETTEAATVTELVGRLIPGYAALPEGPRGDADALLARWEHAVATANVVQAVLAGAAVETGALDVNSMAADDLGTLFADRMFPVEVEEWTGKVPLVLVATCYAPFTEREPPTGNLRWINPRTELTYVLSLAAVGAIELEIGTADPDGDQVETFGDAPDDS